MAKGVLKKAMARKKIKAQQSLALDGEKQAEFEEKVAEMKDEIKKGTRQFEKRRHTPGVVYVGSMPRGFHERQMEDFFSQFGKVLRLRVSRSKKTGNPKGYAFVMFEYDEVAKVVADTMNNYLMFQRLLKCRYVSPDDVHPALFKGCLRKFRQPKAHVLSMARHNAPKSEARMKAIGSRARRKVQKKIDKLAALGIDYSVEVGGKTIAPRPPTTEDDSDEPAELSTPAKQILLEDSSDDEISMKTPPGSIRVKKAKSKLAGKQTKPEKALNTKTLLTKSLKTKGRLGALGGSKVEPKRKTKTNKPQKGKKR